ncbi:MAG TPA: O-antigen ligase family protein [Blastocatellia bacterium]|nr:O-antigen ligase family protein [Blastocatellia bacterium]
MKRQARQPAIITPAGLVVVPADEEIRSKRPSHTLAFIGLFMFTVLLYVRPNELLPDLFGDFSTVKFIAIPTIVIYIVSRLLANQGLTEWPIEMKALAVFLGLCIVFMPLAASPSDVIDRLLDPFLKVVAMFVLMANLIDTRGRLRLMMNTMVISGTCIAIGAIADFIDRKFTVEVKGVATRIEGTVGGIFGNPNDLATSLNLLIPIAIGLALTSRAGRSFYLACAGILAAGVVSTFSRGGFLGLLGMGGFMLWKLSRGNRMIAGGAAAMALLILLAAAPGGYGDRLFSIVNTSQDKTGSAQERKELLKRAILVSARNPITGIGMNNFHIYSFKEHVAHNSFLEVSAELGLGGLAAYLILIFSPLRTMKRIEGETADSERGSPSRELHFLSVGVQGAIVAYIICSTFTSIEYLWYLYYPVAFALAIRRLHPIKSKVGEGWVWKAWRRLTQTATRGALWQREPQTRRLSAQRRGRLIGEKS